MKNLAVVILNYNGRTLLERFLPSVTAHSEQADIVVVDNNSSDESISFIKENYPSIQVVALDKNLGYAGGYNLGLSFLDYNYYVLLNSDVEVTPNWLAPQLKWAEEHPDLGCIQPKILDLNNRSKFEYAGAAGGYIDKDMFPLCRGRLLNVCENDTGQYDTPEEVFWASGAALFISQERFNEVEGFDEDFFAHMEEIDLCWRLQNLGYINYCLPESSVFHLGGGTLSAHSSQKTYLNFRNNLYIITKNYQGLIFFKIFYRMALDGIAAWRFLFRGEVPNFIAVAKAHFSFYLNLPKMLKKRKKHLPKHKIKLKGKINKSLIFNFFIKKNTTFRELI